jgi:Ni/Co efflux regulator RcnB
MKPVLTSVALALIAGSLSFGGGAFAAQDHHSDNNKREASHDQHKGSDKKWRKGGKIEKSDWNRGHQVDYRQHKLRKPPRGYEWREVDGNYVLAAVATGIIASIILSN